MADRYDEMAREWLLNIRFNWTTEEVKALAALLRSVAPQWVSVEERLPDTGVPVLVAGGVAYRDHDGDWRTLMEPHRDRESARLIRWTVTHWMPLPEPPE